MALDAAFCRFHKGVIDGPYTGTPLVLRTPSGLLNVSACGIHTGMMVHSRLKSFSFAKLVHYCTEKYLCVHLSQVHVGGSTQGATYVRAPGLLASAPSAGGLGGAWLTCVRPLKRGLGGVLVLRTRV